MLTLCIDTAYKYLSCCLIKDEEMLAGISMPCFKRQSEEVFEALKQVFENAKLSPKDIDSICISKGPGSYTGVRIGMTIGKVIAETLDIDLYTISTLQLYASNYPNVMVLLNARADRAYVGIYDYEKQIMADCVLPVSEINADSYNVLGDGLLVNRVEKFPDICEAFLRTKSFWKKEKHIAYVVPEYLKESESYYR